MMKHIKIFEDYSDEELDSLRNDLHGIGSDERFKLGKDFGFGTALRKSNNGSYFLCINDRMFSFLLSKNKIKPTSSEKIFIFTDDKEFNIPEKFNSRIVKTPEIPETRYVIQILDKENPDRDISNNEYIPIFDGIIKKLSELKT